MKMFFAMLAFVFALTACQSPGSNGGGKEDAGPFDGTYTADVHRVYSDSNGETHDNQYRGLVAIDQKGHEATNWWGVIATADGVLLDFGSSKYSQGAFWYNYQEYDGSGDLTGANLTIQGNAADASGNEFFQSTTDWTVKLDTEYFQDGWEDVPPNTFDGFAATGLKGSTIPEIEANFLEPRIQAAFNASH